MAQVQRGRYTVPEGSRVVVFLIGMRVNRLRAVSRWLPVARAMPRMLAELARRPDSGLLRADSFVSGRTVLVRQYWRSAEDLYAYASDPGSAHLPAWREFNRAARTADGAVGIFHETYPVGPGSLEAVFVDMPATGVLGAVGSVPVSSARTHARDRLRSAGADRVAAGASAAG